MATEYRRKIVMYAISLYYVLVILAYITTIADTEHYEPTIRYTVAAFGFGITQVNTLS